MTSLSKTLEKEIEIVRQTMGAPHCLTCKIRFAAFLVAIAAALRIGYRAADQDGPGIEALLKQVEVEKMKGHDKGR